MCPLLYPLGYISLKLLPGLRNANTSVSQPSCLPSSTSAQSLCSYSAIWDVLYGSLITLWATFIAIDCFKGAGILMQAVESRLARLGWIVAVYTLSSVCDIYNFPIFSGTTFWHLQSHLMAGSVRTGGRTGKVCHQAAILGRWHGRCKFWSAAQINWNGGLALTITYMDIWLLIWDFSYYLWDCSSNLVISGLWQWVRAILHLKKGK